MTFERRAISLLLCFASSLFLGFPQSLQADEPLHQGRTLTSWLQDLAIGRFPDMEKHCAAVKAIRAIGSDALPVLTERLKITSSDLDTDQDIHTVSAFEALGAEARSAVPLLIELLAPAYDAARTSLSEPRAQLNDRKANAAASTLQSIGDDAVRPLIEALNAEDVRVRFGAAMVLANFRHQSEDIVPALIKALEDEDRDVRWRAARSIGTLRQMPELSVPALAKRLRDDAYPNVRCYAIMALGKFGLDAEISVPDLLLATEDSDSVIRHYAQKALDQVQPPAENELEDRRP
jgi:HEAT repeat protein